MKEIISKELLSEVLGYEVAGYEKNIFVENSLDILPLHGKINIYELAHKCKEWANITKGFYLSSGYDGMDNKWEAVMTQYTFPANTEPEAIFKACQWILDNKE